MVSEDHGDACPPGRAALIVRYDRTRHVCHRDPGEPSVCRSRTSWSSLSMIL